MRLGALRGLTSLPIPPLVDQFRNEEVLTVLPVVHAATARETILVATRPKLAILTAVPRPPGRWMTHWAPWEAVGLAEPGDPPVQDEDVFRLTVLVGGQVFHAQLRGENGRRALRDFVVAYRLSRPAAAARP